MLCLTQGKYCIVEFRKERCSTVGLHGGKHETGQYMHTFLAMFSIQRTLFFIVELLLTVSAELPFEQSFIGHPDTSVDHEGYPMFHTTSEDSHIRCACR